MTAESHSIQEQTTVVGDADGTIRWVDVHPNCTDRSEVADILAAVEAMCS